MTIITALDPQPTPARKTGMFDSLNKVGSAVKDLGAKATDEASEFLGGTKAGQKAVEIGGKFVYGAKEVGKHISEATDKIGGHLSGEEAYKRIQELAAQQTRYNDILATRLAEALDRIEVLEKEVKALSRGR